MPARGSEEGSGATGGVPLPDGRQARWRHLLESDDAARAGLVVPWTLRETLMGAGLTLGPLIVLLVASQLAVPQPASTPPLPVGVDRATAVLTLVVSALVEAVFLIAPLYYGIKTRPVDASPWTSLRTLGLRGADLGRTAVMFIAGVVVIYGFSSLYDQLHIHTNADTLRQQALHAPYTTLASLLVAIVVAPLCEETFFRGFLLPGLARAMPAWAAVVTSALVFGVAHADLGSLVPLVVIGLVVGVLRWRTGSLWPGIALHALNNAVAAVYILSVIHLR
jgi:membrane protease YdiL (CAAX protease family)